MRSVGVDVSASADCRPDGQSWPMVGTIPTTAVMGSSNVGYRQTAVLQDSLLSAEAVVQSMSFSSRLSEMPTSLFQRHEDMTCSLQQH